MSWDKSKLLHDVFHSFLPVMVSLFSACCAFFLSYISQKLCQLKFAYSHSGNEKSIQLQHWTEVIKQNETWVMPSHSRTHPDLNFNVHISSCQKYPVGCKTSFQWYSRTMPASSSQWLPPQERTGSCPTSWGWSWRGCGTTTESRPASTDPENINLTTVLLTT